MGDAGDSEEDLEALLHEELGVKGEGTVDDDGRASKRRRAGQAETDGGRAHASTDPNAECPPHPGFIGGLCIRCGAIKARNGGSGVPGVALSYIHSGLEISRREAARLRDEASARVVAERRLLLVLDLDHTLLNSTRYCDLTQEEGELLERIHQRDVASGAQGVGDEGEGASGGGVSGGGGGAPEPVQENGVDWGAAGAGIARGAEAGAGETSDAGGSRAEAEGPGGEDERRAERPRGTGTQDVAGPAAENRDPKDGEGAGGGAKVDAPAKVERSAIAGACPAAPTAAGAGAGHPAAAGAASDLPATAGGDPGTPDGLARGVPLLPRPGSAGDGRLVALPQIQMWTKLRPGCLVFLMRASRMFELTVYTMGDREYADEMARILDPSGQLFHRRVISAGDSTSRGVKDLDVVLGNEKHVLVVDDTPGVWPRAPRNILRVPRYTFFPEDARRFQTLQGAWLARRRDEPSEDGVLSRILEALSASHRLFFERMDAGQPHPDVRDGLAAVRRRILSHVTVLFSAVIPLGSPPEEHPIWRLAVELGARPVKTLDARVTHVVAPSNSEKVVWGRRMSKHLVTPGWLVDSGLRWRRQDESLYAIPPGPPNDPFSRE